MPSHLRTAVVQATSLGTASNLLAQIVAAQSSSSLKSTNLLMGWLDVPQLLRFVIFSFVTAPLNYQFQLLLEHAFPGRRRRPALFRHKRSDDPEQLEREREREKEMATKWSSSTATSLDWPNTLIKWFLDSISLGTFLNTVAFLGIMGFLKGQPSSLILYNIQTQLAPIVFAGYRVWPIASFISFTCVPLERRIGWNSVVGLFWGVYMSMIAEKV